MICTNRVFSQIIENGRTMIIPDDGRISAVYAFSKVYYVADDYSIKPANCVLEKKSGLYAVEDEKGEEILKGNIDRESLKHNAKTQYPYPFIILNEAGVVLPQSIKELHAVLSGVRNVYYTGEFGEVSECDFITNTDEDGNVFSIVPQADTSYKFLLYFGDEGSDEGAIKIDSGMDYSAGHIPDDLSGKQEIGINISEGEEFNQEKNKVNSTVSGIRSEIGRIKSKDYYVDKYEVIRGGGDNTEFWQLQSAKARCEDDYKRIDELEDCIRVPYRYRVDVEEGEKCTYYLGAMSLSFKDVEIISFFSDYGKRLATYNTKDKELNKNIKLRRELEIKTSKLLSYKNLPGTVGENAEVFREGLTDPFLLKMLEIRRMDHGIKDIILTIQKNQNDIVDAPDKENIIVQGCAGSGKTMIMLHRLSRLQNWVKAFDPKEVLIITPTDYYEMYMKAVTDGLAISKITQKTIESYYCELLAEYNQEFEINKKIKSEVNVDRRFLQYLYSDDFCNDFTQVYKEEISKRNDLLEEIKRIYDDVGMSFLRRPDLSEEKVPDALNNYLDMLLKPIGNTQKTVDDLTNRIKELTEKKDRIEQVTLPERTKEIIQDLDDRYKKAYSILSGKADGSKDPSLEKLLKTYKEDAEKDEKELFIFKAQRYGDDIAKVLRGYEVKEDLISRLEKDLRTIPGEIKQIESKIQEINDKRWSSEVTERIRAAKNMASRVDHRGIYKNIFDRVCEEKLSELGIKRPRGIHRYDLYSMLLFCSLYFEHGPENYKFICVDEGQDLATTEYKLIRDIGKPIMNIYGDVNQAIIPERAIVSWDELSFIGKNHVFELNENYRNSNQIIDFCNKTFDLKISEFGVEGPAVRHSSLDGVFDEINNVKKLHDERWAVVLSRKNKKDKIIDKIKFTGVSGSVIGKNHVSVMYIDEVKGFEFDRVYVITDGMNKTGKYVSCTRALNELIVCG